MASCEFAVFPGCTMNRLRLVTGALLVSILVGAWALYLFWPAPKKYLVAMPPKPAIHAEWPVIDCATENRSQYFIPRTGPSTFLLKIEVRNLPKPDQGLFIAFYPEHRTEDSKRNSYYGGAIFGPGTKKGEVWEFEGEASVTTFRDQRMRAILQRPGEPDFAEVLVTVEPENQN